jgi:anaerobic selenocysteine-containing dehydrogenase
MNSGQAQAVLIVGGANPSHELPAGLGFTDALRKVPFVASLNSFFDDTTSLADLVLPASLPLEDWGDSIPDPSVSSRVLTMQQPIVSALFDTRSAWDVLLAVAEELGGSLAQALPWVTYKDLLQDQLQQLQHVTTGSIKAGTSQQFWTELLRHGGWWDTSATPATALTAAPPSLSALPEAQFDGDAQTYPFYLLPFVHNTLGTGERAHLPWLQAAPDPVTSITWQTWVEVNPRLADSLGVTEGDIVTLRSTHGSIDVPVYVHPAAPPEVLAVPLGQGHSGFGRWADGRGANVLQLLAPLADSATGALAYGSTRVNLAKTGRSVALPKFEGEAPARQLPGQEVIQVLHV